MARALPLNPVAPPPPRGTPPLASLLLALLIGLAALGPALLFLPRAFP